MHGYHRCGYGALRSLLIIDTLLTCLDLRRRRDVMLGPYPGIRWVVEHNGHHGRHFLEREEVLYCKPRLLPRPFRIYLQICFHHFILRNPGVFGRCVHQ